MILLCLVDDLRESVLSKAVIKTVDRVLPSGVEMRVINVSDHQARSSVIALGRPMPEEALSLRAELDAADRGLIVHNHSIKNRQASVVQAIDMLALPPLSPLRSTPVALINVGSPTEFADPISRVLGHLGVPQPPTGPLQASDVLPPRRKASIRRMIGELMNMEPVTTPPSRCLVVSDDVERGSQVARRVEVAGWARVEVTDYKRALDHVLPGAFDVVLLDGNDPATDELEKRLGRADPYAIVTRGP